MSVFVGSGFVAQYPGGGGNFWVPLQYLLGLRALGVDAYWLELHRNGWPLADPAEVAGTPLASWPPENPGLRFFRTLDEAVTQLRETERDYATAARAARALTRDVFDTAVTVPALLKAAGG